MMTEDHYDYMTRDLPRCRLCAGVPGMDCDCGEETEDDGDDD